MKRVWNFFSSNKTTSTESQRATSTQHTPPQPTIHDQRRASVTDAHTVADTLNSGNVQQIQRLMSHHVIRTKHGMQGGTQNMKVTENTLLTKTRRSASLGGYSEMKTFDLSSADNASDGDAIVRSATYYPMTGRDTAWDVSDTANPRVTNVGYTPHKSGVAVTSQLSGCSIARKSDGTIAHVQPPKTGSAGAGIVGAQKLRLENGVQNVLGSETYLDTGPTDTVHQRTNTVMVKDKHGTVNLIAQSVYKGDGSDARHMVARVLPFGNEHPTQRFRSGSMTDTREVQRSARHRSGSVGTTVQNSSLVGPTRPRQNSVPLTGSLTGAATGRDRSNSSPNVSHATTTPAVTTTAQPEKRRDSLPSTGSPPILTGATGARGRAKSQ